MSFPEGSERFLTFGGLQIILRTSESPVLIFSGKNAPMRKLLHNILGVWVGEDDSRLLEAQYPPSP